jgi:hypothetical protein|tara:strand:+ start:4807 stop:5412 length:606 start_codon:yes stop_codon:yes gene_type:complete
MAKEMYVTVDKTTGARKCHQAVDYAVGNTPGDTRILAASVAEFGGATTDYLIFRTTDDAVRARLHRYEEFEGTIVDGVVTALDFTIEESKQSVGIVTDAPGDRVRRYEDGTFDPIFVTITIYNSDGTVDTKCNDTEIFDILNTTGKVIPSEVTFTNGVATFQFKPAHFGYYTFPSSNIRTSKNEEFRVKNQLRIQVYFKAI